MTPVHDMGGPAHSQQRPRHPAGRPQSTRQSNDDGGIAQSQLPAMVTCCHLGIEFGSHAHLHLVRQDPLVHNADRQVESVVCV